MQFPVPSQQPFGQEFASHTQVPVLVLHSWPDAHPEHVAPPFPHDAAVCDA
jgi:hypothetical protein